MTSKELEKSFLTLVRLGICQQAEEVVPQRYDWPAIKTLAAKQGLLAVVLDGIECLRQRELPATLLPEKREMVQWIGDVMANYDRRCERYRKSLAELSGFYNAHGLKMMVLKGYACSLDWPRPEHRPCGDFDLWFFGKQKEADALLEREKGIKVDGSHHKHSGFRWGGFLVENHYDFVNVHHHKSNKEFERMLKELADENNPEIGCVELNGEKVYVPSANFHTLFLLRHMIGHFASVRISLRQVLDWGFHIKAHADEIDWPWVKEVLEKYGMQQAFRLFNAICVEDLGFEPGIFHGAKCDVALKQRVLDDIFSPEFEGETPKGFFSRAAFKYRRWKANAWKHRLCYKESLWSSFWSGVWSHLQKQRTI